MEWPVGKSSSHIFLPLHTLGLLNLFFQNGIIQTQNGTYVIGDLDLDQSQTIIPSDVDVDLLPSLRVATADSDDVPEDDTICPEDLISAQTLEDHDYIDLEGDLHTTPTTTTTSPKG